MRRGEKCRRGREIVRYGAWRSEGCIVKTILDFCGSTGLGTHRDGQTLPQHSSGENVFHASSALLAACPDIFNIWYHLWPDPHFYLPMFVHPSRPCLVLQLAFVCRAHPFDHLYPHNSSEDSLGWACLSRCGDWHSQATVTVKPQWTQCQETGADNGNAGLDDGPDGAVGIDPYSKNKPETCAFLAVLVCNRQTIGIGRIKMTKSVTTLMELTMMSSRPRFTHRGFTDGFQTELMGRHCSRLTIAAVRLWQYFR